MIYCHGNSCDMGQNYLRMLDMALNCKIDILQYEYPGFGCYKGIISD